MTTPVRDLFGIDTRSLAVFRIALALAILADLLIRAPDLGALYTEEGVLPRALLDDQVRARAPALVPILNLVPHLLFDGALGQGLLFAVAGVVAVLLGVGWRTRWVTIASWVLLMSLQARNPAVRNGGDEIFRLLLFWAMFLPLGASWSVDAGRAGGPASPRIVTGGAPAALLLQVALIYPFNALYKDGAAWTTDFTALELFLGNATWSAAWGTALLDHPDLLRAMTAAVLGLERFGWLLAFCPLWHGPARTLAVVLFAGFHGGILVLSQIDFFAVVGIVAWTVFLPGWFWTTAAAALGRHDPPDARLARQPVPKLQGAAALATTSSSGAPGQPCCGRPRWCCRSISSGTCSRRSRPGGAGSWWRAARPRRAGRWISWSTGSRSAPRQQWSHRRVGSPATAGGRTSTICGACRRTRETGWAAAWRSLWDGSGTPPTTGTTAWRAYACTG